MSRSNSSRVGIGVPRAATGKPAGLNEMAWCASQRRTVFATTLYRFPISRALSSCVRYRSRSSSADGVATVLTVSHRPDGETR